MHDKTLTAANDNPGGANQIDLALDGLIRLLARAEAQRSKAAGVTVGAVQPGRPANDPAAPRKGQAK